MMNRLKNVFRYNLPIKAASLVVAVVLWLVVMADQNPVIEGTFDVPIMTHNAPDDYKVVTAQNTATITVQGLRSHLITAEASSFSAAVDLADLAEGTHQVALTATFPQNFEIVSIKPESIRVTLDPYIDRQIPAELIVTGQTAPGTTVAKVGKNMEMVTVSGPKSKVNTVTRVVGYVGLSGNNEDFSLNAPITAINADGREVQEVRVLPSSLVVSVQLARGLTRKIVGIVASAEIVDVPEGFTAKVIKINPQKIEIAGEAAVIDSLNVVKTEPISVGDANNSGGKMVKLDLPKGVTVTDPIVAVDIALTPQNKEAVPAEENANDDKID